MGLGAIAGVVLALVFAVAGFGKAARRSAVHDGFAGLGLPAAGLLAVAVPIFELCLAVALVLVPRVGGVAALATLTAFSAVLVRALRRGDTGCACFGSVRAARVHWWDLARNATLGLLALLAITAPM